ncbi:MAG: LLM class flavin-dependent oxidoreductase [Pseudomonadales bacterium]
MDIEIILEPDCTPGQVAEIAVEAEKHGVRSLWASNYHNKWDCFMSLIPAAQATSKIQLGALAVSPFEMHPLKIANSLLTLNELSNGRAMVAIGGGGAVAGALQTGWDPKKWRIVRAVREAVEIVQTAIDGDFHMKYEGEIFNIVRPYQMDYATAPRPKVYTCSSGGQMLRMGARVADGVHMSDVTPELIIEHMVHIQDGLAKRESAHDSFRASNFWAWHIKKDREKSMMEARRELVWRGAMVPPFHNLERYLSAEEAALIKDNWDYFLVAFLERDGDIDEDEVPPELVERCIGHFASAGDESDIDREIERFKVFKDAGLTDLAIRLFDDPMDSLKMITDRVIPALK